MALLTAPSDTVLREALAAALERIGSAPLLELRRRPSPYRTSFPLEELELTLANGDRLELAFKQLDWDSLEEEAQVAKPAFLHDPRREIEVYASLLAPVGIGPRYYGATIEPEQERHWLFVEWVEGRELYQVGELELWRAVARWLGEAHAALAGAGDRRAALPLLEYDAAYYRCWIERARELRGGGEAVARRALEWLGRGYDAVVEELLELPQTVIHGEFYASNVLIAGDQASLRVAPVDWEMAARGPGLVDLVALTSGGWDEAERSSIVAAYGDVPGVPSFSDRQLDLVRLHLAVQWLGWAPSSWVPPEGQRHDWLGEALILAKRLDL